MKDNKLTRLTHAELARELGDMIRANKREPNPLPALEESVRTWWTLHLIGRHYDDLKGILNDLERIDLMLAEGLPADSDERVFLETTRQVLTSEKCRHEIALRDLIASVGGHSKYGMLSSLFPCISEWVHIEGKGKKP